jgi:uncharacterized membrane protein YdbT with pleckstrin-like domain
VPQRLWRASLSFRAARPPSPARLAEESGAALPTDLVVPVVPEQILHEDEVVLLLAKPSILFIFYSSAWFVVTALMLGVLIAQLTLLGTSGYFTPTTVAVIAALAVVGRLIWALLVWTSHIYMLTNQRIVTIKGVLNVHMFQANLRKIQKTDVYRPLVQRLLGTGTLAFSTAAAGGDIDSTWVMIARPDETHEQIVAAINKTHSR